MDGLAAEIKINLWKVMMSADLTSIIIISYNTRKLTDRLLKSVYRFCEDNPIEIIVVDNASKDDSVSFFKTNYPEIILIENNSNLGFGRAVNQALKKSTGKYLWLVNSDCELTSPILTKLINVFETHPEAGAVTPKILDTKGKFHSCCRRFPNYKNLFYSRGSFLSKLPFFKNKADDYTLPDYDQLTQVESVGATALLIKRADFRSCSGFDERFFMYFEDTDLCYQLHEKNKLCYYEPSVSIRHELWGSSKDSQTQRLIHHHKSALEYFIKRHHKNIAGNIFLAVMLGMNLTIQVAREFVKKYRADHA